MDITHGDYKDGKAFYAFDLSSDNALGAATGTLSLLRRGNLRIELKFAETPKTALKLIVFAQIDNFIAIHKIPNIFIDY